MSEQPASSYTGRQRKRTTHWSVKFKDRLSSVVITVGGLGTIVAVTTVFLFLISVVIPLFRPPRVDQASVQQVPMPEDAEVAPIHVALDEYNLLAWSVYPDGIIRKFRLDTGEILDQVSLVGDGPAMTAWSFPQRDSLAVLGFEDGTVRFIDIAFTLDFMEFEDAPDAFKSMKVGEIVTYGNQLAQLTPQRQFRIMGLKVDIQDPIPTGSGHAVVLLDHTRSRNDINYAAMNEEGAVFLQRARGRRNMMTNKVTYRTTTSTIEYDVRRTLPAYITLTGLGDNLYMIWEDGLLRRFDTRDFDSISLAETVDLSPDTETPITAIGYMIGKTTLLVGDNRGGVTAWFRVRPEGITENPDLTVNMRAVELDEQGNNRGSARDVRVATLESTDGLALVPTRRMQVPEGGSPVTSLSPSERKRLFVAGHADGRIRLHNTTVENLQFEVRMSGNRPAEFVTLNPRDSGLVGVGNDGGFVLWDVDVPHSEATFAGYFFPVWYEGSNEPAHTWQSTGGTDDFESKFGLMPLIFGTVKATLYSMMFAVPIAILAAIYTSEFLHPKSKAKIKPVIEMMASLPSVVLGFLAGLVLAQFIETRVLTTLLSFIVVPFTLIFAASLWQLFSRTRQMRVKAFRFPIMFMAIPLGVWIASLLASPMEGAFFQVSILDEEVAAAMITELPEHQIEYDSQGRLVVRDIRTWLTANRQNPDEPKFESHAMGGWLILLLPVSSIAMVYLSIRYVNPVLLDKLGDSSPLRFALFDLLKFVAAAAAAFMIALFFAWLFSLFSDARGGVIDQYQQRNAMVVGFMMGFAVVPIIYTISDDAMSAVPDHLRSASLGAGATRWQTATRIIIPTSMSGIFSACMIGFGRAVGETMIVLMAAGNTPIMEWNIFSGFRTLSANIAVEMMEAVEDSTNYRTLFLAAVILFTMTFIINTLAEKVRQNYRKKAYQL